MTKVQIRFRLARPLEIAQLPRVAQAHAIYGIQRVTLNAARDQVEVEFDATRMQPADVESTLAQLGFAIAPQLA